MLSFDCWPVACYKRSALWWFCSFSWCSVYQSFWTCCLSNVLVPPVISCVCCSSWSRLWSSRSSYDGLRTWTWPRTPATLLWPSMPASQRWSVWLSHTSTWARSHWRATSRQTLSSTKVREVAATPLCLWRAPLFSRRWTKRLQRAGRGGVGGGKRSYNRKQSHHPPSSLTPLCNPAFPAAGNHNAVPRSAAQSKAGEISLQHVRW